MKIPGTFKIAVIILFFLTGACRITAQEERPAIIVLTDVGGDTDDEQSLVRLLLYADKLDIKVICATSRLNHGQDTRPEIIKNTIEAYAIVYPNLIKHSGDYPNPERLRATIKNGNGDQYSVGEGYSSEASERIIEVITETSTPVYIAVWGGQRELLQALLDTQKRMPEEEFIRFCRKIRVYAIGDQDNHRKQITENFKEVKFVAGGYIGDGGYKVRKVSAYRGIYMTGDTSMQNLRWVKEHIHGHGALGECYQLNGHGTDGMKEGDSPSFMGWICNGLNVPEKPEWGGWGGRYRLLDENLYIDASDFLNGEQNERHSVSRWRKAFQYDFMARMDRCLPDAYANHNPVVIVNGFEDNYVLELHSKRGERLRFEASESFDPDGDTLSYRWFIYDELSNMGKGISLNTGKTQSILFIDPEYEGKEIHLILEVTDNGTPPLTSYKRIVIYTDR